MTFRFDGPGYYVTADGRKALVGAPNKDTLVGVIYGDRWYLASWNSDGSVAYVNDSGGPSGRRLTGPWVDPPAKQEPIEAWAVVMGGRAIAVSLSEADANDVSHGAPVVRLTDQPDAELLKAAEAEIERLTDALRLIKDQDQGCGGNLRADEIYRSMQRIANDALRAAVKKVKER